MLRMRLLAGLTIALRLAAPLPASAETAPAGSTELNEIIDDANRIWNPPPTPEPAPSMVTDVTCDLVLFDGNEIVRDWGFACQSVQLIHRIEAIGSRRRE